MCWNEEVSMISFIIGFGVSSILFIRNKEYDKLLSSLVFFYSFMQYFEARMWAAIKRGDEKTNLFYTKCAYIILWSHVFAIGLGFYLETGNPHLMIVGLLIWSYGLYVMPKMKPSLPTPTSNGHLVWGFDHIFYIYIFILIIAYCLQFTNLKYTGIPLAFYVLSFIYTWITNEEAIGSMWCWFAAFFSFVPLITI